MEEKHGDDDDMSVGEMFEPFLLYYVVIDIVSATNTLRRTFIRQHHMNYVVVYGESLPKMAPVKKRLCVTFVYGPSESAPRLAIFSML